MSYYCTLFAIIHTEFVARGVCEANTIEKSMFIG